MSYEVRIDRFYPVIIPQQLFEFCTESALLQRWLAPAEMVAIVREITPTKNGAFLYDLRGRRGLWKSIGRFTDVVPYISISFVEDRLIDPDGNELESNLESKIEFDGHGDGTKIKFTQTGFFTSELASNAEICWNQRFSYLANIVDHFVCGNVEESEPRVSGTPMHSSYLTT